MTLDTARAADQSWPHLNRAFGPWPPAQKRERRPGLARLETAQSEVTTGRPVSTIADRAAQRAVACALARAAALDRRADLLLQLNMPAPAERLAHAAAELRSTAA